MRSRPRRLPPASDAGVRRRAETPGGGDAQRRQPLLQLFGCLAVEGEHEDAGRVGAAVDELDDAAHECLGLARAGRSQDACRPARVLDGGALGVVEPRRVRAARRPARGRRARGSGRRRNGEWASAARSGGERGRGAGLLAAAPSRRPISSRSSAAASPTPRLRGASTSAPKERPRQNGRSRATSGWTNPSRTSVACAANSSAVPFQCQRPIGGSPPSRERRGSPGSSVHERRAANRTPGAAAAARCARSRRPGTSKNNSRGPVVAAAGRAAACRWSDRLSVAARMGGPAGRDVLRPAGHRR